MDDPADARYTAMRWNTPLSPAHADELLAAVGAVGASSLLDLGCGWGELLLRALGTAAPDARGTGVDRDPALLRRARDAARARGLESAARFVAGDVTDWREGGEVTLCIGTAHAWGGSAPALRALRELAPPGGRLLFGDGCWPAPASDAAREIFGEDVLGFEALRDAASAAGWRVHATSLATLAEWDAFEASFRAGRERWAAAHPDDPRAPALRAEMAARRTEYEDVHRGVLGFAYLVLGTA